jgi:acylphosphatase
VSKTERIARRYFVRGRVQGVGYRWFAQKTANLLGVRGYARNLDDGRVEVYALGGREQLDTFAAHLWKGPNFADVRGVDQQEAALERVTGFDIER